MDEIRTDIWDLVYKSGPQTVKQLAQELRLSPETMDTVVDHVWFRREADTISIATN